jgi:hypothetical protein
MSAAKRSSVEERLAALEAENLELRSKLDAAVADFGEGSDLSLEGQFVEDPTAIRGLADGLRPYWSVPAQLWQMKNYRYRKAEPGDFVDTDDGCTAMENFERSTGAGIAGAGHTLLVCRQEDFELREAQREMRGAAASGDRELARKFADKEQPSGTAFVQHPRHGDRRVRRK